MKTDKTAIRLCMGSSCYSRGNDRILSLIKEYLTENQLTDEVDFRGHLCQQNCAQGPNLTINETEFANVSESTVALILKDVFEEKENTNTIASKLNIQDEAPHECKCKQNEELDLSSGLTPEESSRLDEMLGNNYVVLKQQTPIYKNKNADS